MDLIKRFVRYIMIDTQSDPHSSSCPSTPKQFNLAKLLLEDLKALGVDAYMDEKHCIVYGRVKANTDESCPRIGFIAHMDTAPDAKGHDIHPKLLKDYRGQTIVLNKELNITMDPETFPVLKKDIGSDLILTDGTTLLGADDKAGVAEIMDMLEELSKHPELKHGDIAVAFTPDEEVGRGTENFDIAAFDVDYAYTVDGSDVNGIEYENFNASSAKVIVKGVGIHTGSAKGKMLNSIQVAMEFQQMLPKFEDPSCTEGYEGFHHLDRIEGRVEETTMEYILRDHDRSLLDKKEADFLKAAEYLNHKYGQDTVKVEIKQTYANMKSIIEKHPEIIERVKTKMRELGLNPKSEAIRGGTDGAALTYAGLPCPNLGTGGRNFHGRYEYACVREMRLASALLLKIATID